MRRPRPDRERGPAPAHEAVEGPAAESEPSSAGAEAAADQRAIRTAALALLAGRDFSRHELAVRLRRKGHATETVEAVIAGLEHEGLLREARYVEQFVGQHVRRGHGPLRIRMELREKGVAAEVVDQALDAAGADWVQVAREVRRRKFGPAFPADARTRAKQARFLQYRGFSSTQTRAALGPGEDGPDHDP